MRERFNVPQGVKDFPPHRAQEIRRLEDSLMEEFARWGYRPVITPLFESVDTLTVGLGEDLRDKILKFVDPSTGEIVALRPDITPQVGRMVAEKMNNTEGVLRLCYKGRVVRFEEKGSGKEREIFQVGCELIRLPAPEADAEIIALSVKAVERLGIKNLIIDLGHTGFLRHLLSKSGPNHLQIESALSKKDVEALKVAVDVSKLSKDVKETLLALPELYGSRDVLTRAKDLPMLKRYVKDIEKVLAIVDEYNLNCEVNIDFGELRGFNYYTGVTFELISPQVSTPLLRGGRYDHLLKSYGYDAPATGFAVDIESIQSITTKSNSIDHQVHFIVIPKRPKLRREAIRLAQWLRSSGFKVVLDLKPDSDLKDIQLRPQTSYAYGAILLESTDKLKLIEAQSGASKEFSNLEELLKGGI